MHPKDRHLWGAFFLSKKIPFAIRVTTLTISSSVTFRLPSLRFCLNQSKNFRIFSIVFSL